MTDIIKQIEHSGLTHTSYWLNLLRRNSSNKKRYSEIVDRITQQLIGHQNRRNLLTKLKFDYPANLPVSKEIDSIKKIVRENQVTIICGETGSGKTTQLPKMLLEMGLANSGIIGHTQPRRIAAKSLASRIAHELGDDSSPVVAYKMRFNDKTSLTTSLKLMTDGILLQEIQNDRLLLQYSALIIDEVHERSLNIDFILGYLKTLLAKRPDLKVIITSATIENNKLAEFFGTNAIYDVSGKTYPVDIIYQPYENDEEDISLNQAIYQAIESALAVELGNGLVFLPGEKEIKSCLNYLRKTNLKSYELLPLFSKQSSEEQAKIFNSNGRIKIIISTNVAETSLTIPGIKFVIDTGLARVKRYNLRNRVEQLNIESVSQASSKQRAGRAGRISHGLCVRLFSETEFLTRSKFSEPELLRSNLANVILKLLEFKLGDAREFGFLDMPDNKAYNEGFRTLFQIGAIDEQNNITSEGKLLTKIPIDVQLGKVLLAAHKFGALKEALIVISFLAIQDPREMFIEHQQLIRERHKEWYDEKSDFNQILKLWQWYHEQIKHKKSNKKLIELCHYHFLSSIRMREWHEMHRQLKEIMFSLNFRENQIDANYDSLHKSLLAGFALNIGHKDVVDSYYRSTNGRKFYIHPSLNLKLKEPWILALSLVETTKLYGRFCAEIQSSWLNDVAGHLFKYTYDSIAWSSKRGQVVAIKHSLLFGLEVHQHKISYANIDSKYSREVMLKEGLVANNLTKRFEFIIFNGRVIDEIEKIEDKLRTSFAIIDDELFEFYNDAIPLDVFDVIWLEQYLKQFGDAKLRIDKQKFIAKLTNDIQHHELYPEQIRNKQNTLRVKYVFDHDSDNDGMNVQIKLTDLFNLNVDIFEWLVPGLIRDKVTYLIKSLPKATRLQFNPLQDSVSQFLENADCTASFAGEFCQYAQAKNISLDIIKLKEVNYPTYLVCHFAILQDKKIVTNGDNLSVLQQKLTKQFDSLIVKHSQVVTIINYVPELQKLLQQSQVNNLVGYNALAYNAKQNQIELCVVANLAKAISNTKIGLVELFRLQLAEQIKYLRNKKNSDFNSLALIFRDEYTAEELLIACERYIIDNSILQNLPNDLTFTAELFQDKLNQIKQTINEMNREFNTCITSTARLYKQIKQKILSHELAEEISEQLDWLIYSGFLKKTKWNYLRQYPRYLQAIIIRLEKYTHTGSVKDHQLSNEITKVFNLWYDYVDELEGKDKPISESLADFYYKIEELKISFFAQEIKTLYSVSTKRLLAELECLYRDALLSK